MLANPLLTELHPQSSPEFGFVLQAFVFVSHKLSHSRVCPLLVHSVRCSQNVQFTASTRQLTAICNFSSRESDALYWSLRAPDGHIVHRHLCKQNTLTHKLNTQPSSSLLPLQCFSAPLLLRLQSSLTNTAVKKHCSLPICFCSTFLSVAVIK